jgi:hypothetical protein
MTQAFEQGFVSELRLCLGKLAAAQPAGGVATTPPPATQPPSPFAPGRAPPGARSRPGQEAQPLPGLHKGAGVASGLEDVYLTLAPSAAAKKALRYATPRMDAHLLGQDAAKLMARRQTGFGDAVARGRRSAGRARGVLEEGAVGGVNKTASPFAAMMRLLGAHALRLGG